MVTEASRDGESVDLEQNVAGKQPDASRSWFDRNAPVDYDYTAGWMGASK
jgi:hypothetical protein